MLNFESVNCDGKHINWEFNTLEEVHRLFWSEDCPLPSNDDLIVHAELDGKPLPKCIAFLDLLRMLGLDEEQYPPEKGKTHKLVANGGWTIGVLPYLPKPSTLVILAVST